jgi:superfamily II DNA/RNA helicase
VKGALESTRQGARIDGRNVMVVVFDEVDQLLAENPAEVETILKLCPSARPLFVSATIAEDTEVAIRRVLGKGVPMVIRTEQKTRPAFQADFILLKHEQKVDTMRRIQQLVTLMLNEVLKPGSLKDLIILPQVPHSGKKMIFTSRVAYVEGLADKYRRPKEQGGFGLAGTIGVHANSHDNNAVARMEAINRFKEVWPFGFKSF